MNAQAQNVALAARLYDRLPAGSPIMSPLAITDHARTLRRAQLTLRRWAEEMCNGTIQRDGEQGDGRPFRVFRLPYSPSSTNNGQAGRLPIPDRERGALARVAATCEAMGLHWYHQTDPRGCALYVAAEPLTADNYSQRGIPCL